MKNKKGFTFVELVAVITIIGVLAIIILPTIEKITKENKEKVYQQQLDNIILSLKSWASDNRTYLPEEESEILTITLGNLKSEGYIEYETKNPLTGKCFDNSMALIITKIKKNYDYSIDLNTIKESNNCEVNVNSPVIALNGNMVENVEVNSIYIDKGVIAKDKNGNDITDRVITTITGSGNVVNTSKIGNQYIITYSVTDNHITAEISRIVKIVDTTAPDLIIPNNVVIDNTITNIDIMNGVSATDNSGENIEIITKGSINFGVVGKYVITYTAKDSSGNISTKKRTITINEVVNGIMSSESTCIKDATTICPNGTLVSVQVNETQTYNFYVIKDTGTKLTLIMDRNLGEREAWIASNRYIAENDDETGCATPACTDEGPLTLLETLKSRTSSWINIPEFTYTVGDEASSTVFSSFEVKNVRARNLTLTEAQALGCSYIEYSYSCPPYLYSNLSVNNTSEAHYGYWTTAPVTLNINNYGAYLIHYDGRIHHASSFDNYDYGIRPVIELTK